MMKTISEIRTFFHTIRRPTYFVSATPFNLLGFDEWVQGFKYVTYIDCFDRAHPSVFVPHETPHAEFTCIEDINNYLLEHKEVVDFLRADRRGHDGAQAAFLMFDAKTESICAELGLEIAFPSAKLRGEVDDKVNTTRIGDRAKVPSVPNVLAKVDSYARLREASRALGPDLVVQTAFGDSGHTTFFISDEKDFERHAAEIAREPEVKIMKRIRCRGTAMEACVTRSGTLVGPLMTELVGFPELTPYRGGWCGNELFADVGDDGVRERARRACFAFGEELRKMGYRGYFEIDFLTDLDSGEVYLGEVNPRVTGASLLTNQAAFAHGDAPLFLFHLLEHSGAPFEIDVEDLNRRFADRANIDSWSQLVVKHTQKDVDRITRAPRSGLHRLREGRVDFVMSATHPRVVQDESDGFFLRISGEGDYRYEGADLGILLVRGRLMTDDHALTPRARAWIDGIRAAYAGAPLESPKPPAPSPFVKLGRFKIL
jgi:hypothetical protein